MSSTFFRAALPYRITQDVPLFQQKGVLGQDSWEQHRELNKALATKVTREPASQELATYGFCDPFPVRHKTLAEINEDPEFDADGDSEVPTLVRPLANGRFLMMAARYAYRNLPGAVVKHAVGEKVNEIEQAQARKVYRKERDQIKDEIVQQFLPRAFVQYKITRALVDTESGLIWIDSASAKTAENFLSTLREALGSLPVRPLTVKLAPSASFTQWIKDERAPANFHLLDSALFEDTCKEGGKVGAMRQDLTSEQFQLIVGSGMIATKIAVAWEDKIGFVLNDKMQFTKIAFDDMLKEQAQADSGEDVISYCQTSYLLMGHTLREMLEELLPHLGGEDIPQGI